MVKQSIIHLSIAAIMLRRGWLSRYLPPIAQQYLGQPIIDAAGYAWAALLAVIAVANLVIALECSIAAWGWFISFGAKAAAFGPQYAVFRAIIARRIAAARLVPSRQPAWFRRARSPRSTPLTTPLGPH